MRKLLKHYLLLIFTSLKKQTDIQKVNKNLNKILNAEIFEIKRVN